MRHYPNPILVWIFANIIFKKLNWNDLLRVSRLSRLGAQRGTHGCLISGVAFPGRLQGSPVLVIKESVECQRQISSQALKGVAYHLKKEDKLK